MFQFHANLNMSKQKKYRGWLHGLAISEAEKKFRMIPPQTRRRLGRHSVCVFLGVPLVVILEHWLQTCASGSSHGKAVLDEVLEFHGAFHASFLFSQRQLQMGWMKTTSQ